MATYKKTLKDRAGNTIIPVVDVINYLYPVGSIYMSATMSTVAQVQAAFGGTWVKWGAGRVPVGVNTSETEFNTVEKTGGVKSVYVYEENLPVSSVIRTNNFRQGSSCDTDNVAYSSGWCNGSVGDSGHTYGQSLNNLQPYITCYMYKRTA